jgi:hypothetical protein
MIWIRSVLAIVIGMAIITGIAEAVEYLIVSVIKGVKADPANPDAYFAARNESSILALKHVYNFLAGLAGGFIGVWVAGRKEMAHGWVLMLIQALAIAYAMLTPSLAKGAPLWAWVSFGVATLVGIYAGALLRVKRKKRLTAG